MTTEPREEANEIVRGVVSWDWESGSDWDDHYESVVDALAAAKRAEDAHRIYEDVRMDGAGDMAQGDALDELRGALSDLSAALSALREDEM